MMNNSNNAAFPIEYSYMSKVGTTEHDHEQGLTKLEYISAMAMQGLLTKYNLSAPQDQKTIAQLSVELAKSLLTELENQ